MKVGDGKERTHVWLRRGTSDWDVYGKVFVEGEYRFRTTRAPRFIVDAGANVGMASVYFATQYPTARIIALEPESGNFEMLCRNVAAFPQVTPVQGALWRESGQVTIKSVGLAEDGFMVEQDNENGEITSFSVTSLLSQFGPDEQTIDLLKIDIEGSEKEVFESASSWLSSVDSIVVELHENMRNGSVRSYYENTISFGKEWTQGENICLTKGLLTRGASGK